MSEASNSSYYTPESEMGKAIARGDWATAELLEEEGITSGAQRPQETNRGDSFPPVDVPEDEPLAIDIMNRHELKDGTAYYSSGNFS